MAERTAHGKARRRAVPRGHLGGWSAPADRPDPVELILGQATDRVPDLVPIRHGRMLESPFAFFRGAALIMATDLASGPHTGLVAQLCGDAHLSNFGVFNTPERRMVFSLNDFDETLPGPWEWDLKRLVASIEIAGRDIGIPEADRRAAVLGTARTYRTAMREFAGRTNMYVWYASLDVETVMGGLRGVADPKRLRRVERDIAKARTRDSLRAALKLTQIVDGEPRIAAAPPLITPVEDLLGDGDPEEFGEGIAAAFRRYRTTLPSERRALLEQYRLVHLARKVVGVGSVGTRCWIALLLGRDGTDPLILQFKEAPPSVLAPFVPAHRHRNEGQRVVHGQRMMQAASDIFLGWQRMRGVDGVVRDYYARQFHDGKGSAVIEALSAPGLGQYAAVCGWTLARAHARSGDRVAIAAYLGSGDTADRAMADFATAYADQNARDFAAFTAAAESGRVAAIRGT